jgi:hypothetical protein
MELIHLVSVAQWQRLWLRIWRSLVRSPAFVKRRFFGFVNPAHWLYEFASVIALDPVEPLKLFQTIAVKKYS